jgi:hypothetical protein
MYQVTLFDDDGAIVGIEHFTHWTDAMTFMVKLGQLFLQAPLNLYPGATQWQLSQRTRDQGLVPHQV